MSCGLTGLKPGEKVTSHKCLRTGKVWPITSAIDCQTSNVVYKITCIKPQCKSWVYIGETSQRLCDRLTQHRGYVHRKENKPVGVHFNMKGHSIEDLRAVAIEKVLPLNDDLLRKRRESMWINRYDSVSFGANTRD